MLVVMVGGIFMVIGGRFAISALSGPETTTVHGTQALYDYESMYLGRGAGGYVDINSSTQVILTNENGKVLGSTILGTPRVDYGSLTYSFSITDVPTDYESYSISVSHRGTITHSRQEMENSGWTFDLVLGDN